ncbi:TPA: helix-turn-helix transcriptional regulator [Salmonella enterica]
MLHETIKPELTHKSNGCNFDFSTMQLLLLAFLTQIGVEMMVVKACSHQPMRNLNRCVMTTIRIIKVPEALERCAMSRASLYRMLQRNEFPRQVRIGIRSVGFYEHEVNQWLADRQRVQ